MAQQQKKLKPSELANIADPLLWLRRKIKASAHFEQEELSHSLKFLEQIRAQVGEDPRQQALAQHAVTNYVLLTRLTAMAMKLAPDDKRQEKLASLIIRYQGQLAKSIRLAGLQAKGAKKKGGGSVFTPARNLKQSENPTSSQLPKAI